jgi:hypothetical protein
MLSRKALFSEFEPVKLRSKYPWQERKHIFIFLVVYSILSTNGGAIHCNHQNNLLPFSRGVHAMPHSAQTTIEVACKAIAYSYSCFTCRQLRDFFLLSIRRLCLWYHLYLKPTYQIIYEIIFIKFFILWINFPVLFLSHVIFQCRSVFKCLLTK